MIICLSFASPRPLEPFAEACYAFTPQIAVRKEEAVFLELRDFPVRLHALCKTFFLSPAIGKADHPAFALAYARYGVNRPDCLPLHALFEMVSPFERDAFLNDEITWIITRLQKLGLKSVRDYQQLPLASLPSRFGKTARLLHDILHERHAFAWPRFVIPEVVAERVLLENPYTELEPLLFVLKHIFDRLLSRLYAREKRISAFELVLVLENKAKRIWHICLPVAQGTTTGLMPILREKLDFDLQYAPLSAAVTGVDVTILETVPGHKSQRDFFSQKEVRDERLDELLGRLVNQLGEKKVFAAEILDTYLPEKTYGRSSFLEKRAQVISEKISPRPTRLLAKPIPMKRQGNDLKEMVSGRVFQTRQWQGPERLQTPWWEDVKFAGVTRDYYEVLTKENERLWVFMSQDRLYLHGFFD